MALLNGTLHLNIQNLIVVDSSGTKELLSSLVGRNFPAVIRASDDNGQTERQTSKRPRSPSEGPRTRRKVPAVRGTRPTAHSAEPSSSEEGEDDEGRCTQDIASSVSIPSGKLKYEQPHSEFTLHERGLILKHISYAGGNLKMACSWNVLERLFEHTRGTKKDKEVKRRTVHTLRCYVRDHRDDLIEELKAREGRDQSGARHAVHKTLDDGTRMRSSPAEPSASESEQDGGDKGIHTPRAQSREPSEEPGSGTEYEDDNSSDKGPASVYTHSTKSPSPKSPISRPSRYPFTSEEQDFIKAAMTIHGDEAVFYPRAVRIAFHKRAREGVPGFFKRRPETVRKYIMEHEVELGKAAGAKRREMESRATVDCTFNPEETI